MMRIQTNNGLGDLIFLTMSLVVIGLCVRALWLAFHRRRAIKTVALILALVGGYGKALVVTGLMTPTRLVPAGTVKCSDEWCASVEGATEFTPTSAYSPKGRLVAVRVRISSEARARTQSGSNPVIYIATKDGQRYYPSAGAQAAVTQAFGVQPELTRPVAAGDSFVTLIAFDLPSSAHRFRVNIGERPWITKVILFNDNSLLAGGTLFDVELAGR